MNWTSLAGVLPAILSPIVAIVAILVTARTARFSAATQRQVSLDQKLWDSRSEFYLELLSYSNELSNYSINRVNNIVAIAYEPDLHGEESAEMAKDYPPTPAEPDHLRAKLVIFASREVNETMSICLAAARILELEKFDPLQSTPDDFAAASDGLLQFVLEEFDLLDKQVSHDLQVSDRRDDATRPDVTSSLSWQRNEISVDGKIVWRGFQTNSIAPGLRTRSEGGDEMTGQDERI